MTVLELADYEEAAYMNNRCRTRGIAGSAVDFLICAAAHRCGWGILTTDRDFQNYASVLPLRLHSASTSDRHYPVDISRMSNP